MQANAVRKDIPSIRDQTYLRSLLLFEIFLLFLILGVDGSHGMAGGLLAINPKGAFSKDN